MNAPKSRPLFSRSRLIVLLALALVGGDILLIGPEVFSLESFGTLMLSPSIYVSISPAWIGAPLAHGLHAWPGLNLLVCGMPLLMLGGAAWLGAAAFRRDSTGLAIIAFALVAAVFGVYHLVQPMGFRVLD